MSHYSCCWRKKWVYQYTDRQITVQSVHVCKTKVTTKWRTVVILHILSCESPSRSHILFLLFYAKSILIQFDFGAEHLKSLHQSAQILIANAFDLLQKKHNRD